ncbi:MAG TPA: hypothetical protein VN922_16940 [Bacteroidia bacterium]|nr:hypothetical protein [Bacteroidia bacterium]
MSDEYDRTVQVKAFEAVQKKLNARFGDLDSDTENYVAYTDFYGDPTGGSNISLDGRFTIEDLKHIVFLMEEYEADFPVKS